LDGLVLCQDGLHQFLARRSSTLKVLELCQIALWQGSFKSLLFGLREVLKLRRFGMRGILKAFHAKDVRWALRESFPVRPDACCPNFIDFYDCCPTCWEWREHLVEYQRGSRPEVEDTYDSRRDKIGYWLNDFVTEGKNTPDSL
jgi:hypothetical protein